MAAVLRILPLVLFASACCVFAGCEKESPSGAAKSGNSPVAGTVQLEIQFNSDRKNIKVAVPCSADSTVFTILERARNMGDLKFKSSGLAAKDKFVTSIDGVDNLASAGDNWVYRVNEELGDKSSGLYSVSPGDQVFWVFGKYSGDSE